MNTRMAAAGATLVSISGVVLTITGRTGGLFMISAGLGALSATVVTSVRGRFR